MKKGIISFTVLSLSVLGFFVLSPKQERWYDAFNRFATYSGDELNNLPKYDRPDLAELHDFQMTKDLSLGYPPTERLIQGYEYTRSLMSGRRAIEGVKWTERGPNNFGGRT
ncbi:MAG: hypothetical protein RJQ14_04335 [Marinoscillum sp.]